MVLLLAVRTRSASSLMSLLLVFEAPPQEGLVRSVPTTLGVRSFQRLPAYVPLTFHRSLRAECPRRGGWPGIGVLFGLARHQGRATAGGAGGGARKGG